MIGRLVSLVPLLATVLGGWNGLDAAVPARGRPDSSASASVDRGDATTLAVDFSFAPQNPTPGVSVKFVDESDGTITSRLWDFGDGSTSGERTPRTSSPRRRITT